MHDFEYKPNYRVLAEEGELARRARHAVRQLAQCDLCARYCLSDRRCKPGACGIGRKARVGGHIPFYGEEASISGQRGSGAIFFAGGDLRNPAAPSGLATPGAPEPDASGEEATAGMLANRMLELQRLDCHNINLVNPSHVVAQILEALALAAPRGLRLPLVYTSHGYDSPQALALLEGIIDIYMPEMKFGYSREARRFLLVRDYPAVNRAGVRAMQRQVGDLVISEEGIALRGLLVRHTVLPNGLAGTPAVVRFLARRVSANTYLHLIDDYRPTRSAKKHPDLYRRITPREFETAMSLARASGLQRLGGVSPRQASAALLATPAPPDGARE